MFSARAIGTVQRLLDLALLQIGELSVTALELALTDQRYADQLRQRAGEVGSIVVDLDNPLNPLCDHCLISVTDAQGNTTSVCGTDSQCQALGGFVIIAILVWLAIKFIQWLT
jgi:hypothetical protein